MTIAEKIVKYNEFPEVQVKLKKSSSKCFVSDEKDTIDILDVIYNHDTLYYTESFMILMFKRNLEFIGWKKISEGGCNETVIDPKVVLTIALKSGAEAIILTHNHPSGNTDPSNEDKNMTKRISLIARFLRIYVLDHIIYYSKNNYYSFKENGNLSDNNQIDNLIKQF